MIIIILWTSLKEFNSLSLSLFSNKFLAYHITAYLVFFLDSGVNWWIKSWWKSESFLSSPFGPEIGNQYIFDFYNCSFDRWRLFQFSFPCKIFSKIPLHVTCGFSRHKGQYSIWIHIVTVPDSRSIFYLLLALVGFNRNSLRQAEIEREKHILSRTEQCPGNIQCKFVRSPEKQSM